MELFLLILNHPFSCFMTSSKEALLLISPFLIKLFVAFNYLNSSFLIMSCLYAGWCLLLLLLAFWLRGWDGLVFTEAMFKLRENAWPLHFWIPYKWWVAGEDPVGFCFNHREWWYHKFSFIDKWYIIIFRDDKALGPSESQLSPFLLYWFHWATHVANQPDTHVLTAMGQ